MVWTGIWVGKGFEFLYLGGLKLEEVQQQEFHTIMKEDQE
jgi:hypothetical protein